MSNKHHFKDSTSITHIDFHEPDTLEICFVSGGTYHYPECDKATYHALKAAASPGKYFHQNLKQLKSRKI